MHTRKHASVRRESCRAPVSFDLWGYPLLRSVILDPSKLPGSFQALLAWSQSLSHYDVSLTADREEGAYEISSHAHINPVSSEAKILLLLRSPSKNVFFLIFEVANTISSLHSYALLFTMDNNALHLVSADCRIVLCSHSAQCRRMWLVAHFEADCEMSYAMEVLYINSKNKKKHVSVCSLFLLKPEDNRHSCMVPGEGISPALHPPQISSINDAISSL